VLTKADEDAKRLAMRIAKLHVFSLKLCLLGASAALNDPVLAQQVQVSPELDQETRYNPQTGRYEVIYNPWNTSKVEAERTERNYQLSRKMTEADHQARAQQRANLKQLSDEIYAANVGLLNHRHLAGLSAIKAGRATTAFTPDPRFSITQYLIQRYPTARSEVERLAGPMSIEFHAALRANSLSEKDLADGNALAFITAFEAYSGQKTAAVHLAFAKRTLQAKMLQSSIDQGASSAERQRDFEHFGVLAFAAKQLSSQGDPMGRELAARIISGLVQAPAHSVVMTATGFGHKGDQIIASGRATTIFSPAATSSTPDFYAQRLNSAYIARSTFENNAREAISTFYAEIARRGEPQNDIAVLIA
jgi:hypothetical protein